MIAAPGSQNGLTPAFVWRIFCSWWKFVVPAGVVLSAAAAAAVWYLHVPMFEASAMVKIEASAPFIAFEQATLSRDAESYVQTQIELLRGPVVLSKLLSEPEVAAVAEIRMEADPLKFLRKKISVRQVGKSELYEISYSSPSARDAATVVNQLVVEYLDLQSREGRVRTNMVISALKDEQDARGRKVEKLRDDYVNLAKEVTGRDPFGQGVVTDVSAFSPAGSLFQSLTEADVSLEVMKAELQALRNAPSVTEDKAIASGLLDLEISNLPDVRRLEEQVAMFRNRLLQIKSKPRTKIGDDWEDDPIFKENQQLLEQTEAELREVTAKSREQLLAARRKSLQAERDLAVQAKQKEVDAMITRRNMLSEKFNQQMAELRQGGAQSAELELTRSELQREQAVFELIAARKLALETEMRAPARVTPVFSATIPMIATEPIPFKLLAIVGLGSMLLPFALAVAYEMILRRIRSVDELLREAELPILGEVARFPLRQVTQEARLLAPSKQRELFVYAESIDGLRTNLMLMGNLGEAGRASVIAVCSASSGEGKTSVATSLAMSIAEASKQPTLIIDADLRDPDVGALLGVPLFPGMSEVLSGKVKLNDALHQVGKTNAYVLPAGEHRVNPHHILQGDRVQNLLAALRKRFATIIIDTPPVLLASEALVYAKAADYVLYCSLVDVSRSDQVRIATERLRSTGAPLAGAVLSGVTLGRYAYQYGAYSREA